MAKISSLPDRRRPLVHVYRSKIHGRHRYEVRWKQDGRWVSKQRTKRDDAFTLASDVVYRLENPTSGLSPSEKRIAEAVVNLLAERLSLHASSSTPAPFEVSHGKTVEEVRDAFLDSYTGSPIRTYNDLSHRTEVFTNHFTGRGISSIKSKEIEEWIREQSQWTPRSKNNVLRSVVTMFNKAKAWGWLPDRTVEPAKIAKFRETKKEPEILSPDYVEKMLKEVRPDLVPYVALCCFAGLRPSEAAGIPGERSGLLWGDIDLEEKLIHVRPEVAGKVGRSRYVQMKDNLVEWLRPHLDSPDRPVCYRKSGELLRADLRPKDLWDEFSADSMRHSFCSYLLALTHDIGHVAEMAGNSPNIIRSNYRRPVKEKVAKVFFSIRPDTT